jgi:hypothetical protein
VVDPAELEFGVGVVRFDHRAAPIDPGSASLAKIWI